MAQFEGEGCHGAWRKLVIAYPELAQSACEQLVRKRV
jgi:hypothetical protein